MNSWRTKFFIVWQGQLLSQLGSTAFNAVVTLWIAYKTNSGILVGYISSIPMIISLLVGLYIGAVSDKYCRRTLIVAADLVSAVMVLILAFYFWLNPEINIFLLGLITLSLTILSLTSMLFSSAFEGIFFKIVPEEYRANYRAKNIVAQKIVGLVGPNLGALLLVTLGPLGSLFIDSLTYFYAALTSLILPKQEVASQKSNVEESLHLLIKDGLQFIRRNALLTKYIAIAVAMNFLIGSLSFVTTFFVKNDLHLSFQWVGFINSINGVGGLLGGFVFGSLISIKPHQQRLALTLSISGIAFGMAVVGFSKLFVISSIGLALTSFSSVVYNIVVMSEIQNATPEEKMGRVFTTTIILANLTTPLSSICAGYLINLQAGSARSVFIVASVLMLAVAAFSAAQKSVKLKA